MNVTEKTVIFLILEVSIGIILILRSLIALKYKLNKGWPKKIYEKSIILLIPRFIILGMLTYTVFRFEG